MNKWLLVCTLVNAGWGLGMLAMPAASSAADSFSAVTTADKPAKTKKPQQAKSPKSPTDKGSAESKADRDKRLLRECRGRPNAGACEGFAS